MVLNTVNCGSKLMMTLTRRYKAVNLTKESIHHSNNILMNFTGYDNYDQSDKYDAYVNFTSIVMLDSSATVGQSYTFTTVADLGGIDAITYTKTITVTDAIPEMVRGLLIVIPTYVFHCLISSMNICLDSLSHPLRKTRCVNGFVC